MNEFNLKFNAQQVVALSELVELGNYTISRRYDPKTSGNSLSVLETIKDVLTGTKSPDPDYNPLYDAAEQLPHKAVIIPEFLTQQALWRKDDSSKGKAVNKANGVFRRPKASQIPLASCSINEQDGAEEPPFNGPLECRTM